MAYTAVMVPMTDFLTGVLSALAIYLAFRRQFGELPDPDSSSRIRVKTTEPVPA
jgi:hypothetical protein